jgi:hypothetical protein
VNKAEDRGDLEDSRGLGVFCTEAAFLTSRWYAGRAASEKTPDPPQTQIRLDVAVFIPYPIFLFRKCPLASALPAPELTRFLRSPCRLETG